MSNKKIIIPALIIGLFVIFFLLLTQKETVQPTPSPTIARKITLGAWTEGLFEANTKTLHPEKLSEFENLINKKLTVAHFYIGWESLNKPEFISHLDTINNNGWQPMVNVNPYFFESCLSDLPLYEAIAAGVCDDFLHAAGKNLSQIKNPFYFVFAWEMNNDQHQWSIPYSASTPKDFVNAWRHVHTIFEEEGVKNIIWVFCPNVPENKSLTYSQFYPGDGFVDWLGIDGYNWGTTQKWSSWVSFEGVFTGAYKSITELSPDKPLVIAEVNSTDQGGDKSKWYEDAFLVQIPHNFPKIKMIVIFNEDKTETENVNWKVDVNRESLDMFKKVIQSDYYKNN